MVRSLSYYVPIFLTGVRMVVRVNVRVRVRVRVSQWDSKLTGHRSNTTCPAHMCACGEK